LGGKSTSDATRTNFSYGLLFGLFAIAMGVAVLAGWLFDIPGLKSVLPGFVTMKPTRPSVSSSPGCRWRCWTAQNASVLRGICRGFARASRRCWRPHLCQYLFGVDFGIDQLIFREAAGAVGTLAPGRMAPAAAVNFLLLGCAIFLASFRRAVPVAQRLVLLTGLIDLLPLVGYVYGATALIGIGQYTQMAVHTAVLFILLSLGVLLLHPADGLMRTVTSDTIGGWLLRRLAPFIVGVPLILGRLRVQGEQRNLFNGPLGVALMMVAMMLILMGLSLDRPCLNRNNAERKLAENQLRDSEMRYRRLFEAAKDGVCSSMQRPAWSPT